MRKILFGAIAIVLLIVGGVAALLLWPAPADRPPQLADSPPLKPATRTSVIIAPTVVALTAIRDMIEAQAPRELSGQRDNPVGQLMQNAQLGWAIARGPLALTGRPEELIVVAQLSGALRLTGQVGAQVGGVASQLGNILGGQIGEQLGGLANRAIDQRAEFRGTVTLNARPAILPNWRLEPNLTGQAALGDANLQIAGVRLNLAREVKPLVDRAVGESMGELTARLRNDPFLETIARREWGKMCRSIPLGKATPDLPDLWLEVRPVRALAGQPKLDANAVTLSLGVQAETRITTAESKPDCPFPAAVEVVAPMDQGRLSLGVAVDLPFTEVNKLIEAQLKGRTFPEDKSGPVEATVNKAALAASGDRLLISLRVKAKEKKSWFGFGTEATVHIWGKPALDQRQQVLRLTDITLDVESEEAFGLVSAAARAAIPYLKDALAAQATIDLKSFAASALKNIQGAMADFRSPDPGVQVEAAVTALRLAGIEFDAKTLRVIAEADGNVRVAVSQLPK